MINLVQVQYMLKKNRVTISALGMRGKNISIRPNAGSLKYSHKRLKMVNLPCANSLFCTVQGSYTEKEMRTELATHGQFHRELVAIFATVQDGHNEDAIRRLEIAHGVFPLNQLFFGSRLT